MFVQASVKAPLQQYRMHMGSYPSTEEGLNALLDAPGGDKARHWKGPYIDTLPEDPWKNRYQYRFPASTTRAATTSGPWAPTVAPATTTSGTGRCGPGRSDGRCNGSEEHRVLRCLYRDRYPPVPWSFVANKPVGCAV
jgi:type II secretory pathway pseudopilin PulG